MGLRVLLVAIVLLCVSIGAQVSAEETTTSHSVVTAKPHGGIISRAVAAIRKVVETIFAIPREIWKAIRQVVGKLPFIPKGKIPGAAGQASSTVAAHPDAAATTTAAHTDAAATTKAAQADAAASTTAAPGGAAASTTAAPGGAAASTTAAPGGAAASTTSSPVGIAAAATATTAAPGDVAATVTTTAKP